MFRDLTDHELHVLEDKLWKARLRAERAYGFVSAQDLGIWQDADEIWGDVEAERCRRLRVSRRV